jgi:hypothetical protein
MNSYRRRGFQPLKTLAQEARSLFYNGMPKSAARLKRIARNCSGGNYENAATSFNFPSPFLAGSLA